MVDGRDVARLGDDQRREVSLDTAGCSVSPSPLAAGAAWQGFVWLKPGS